MKSKKKSSPQKKTSKGRSRASIQKMGDQSLKVQRFLGISLGGGRSDRTAITVLEYFVTQKKLVVSRLADRIKGDGELSSDLKLHEYVEQFKEDIELIGMDVPLTLPKCFHCQLVCPGFESCEEEEILWMWKQFRNAEGRKKTAKFYTPYTRRCAEVFWSKELEAHWALGDALGANQAPLLARGRFVARRWNHKVIETIPRLALLRCVQPFRLSKMHVRNHRHSVDGDISREHILKQLIDHLGLFIYDQDKHQMAENLNAFDSLLIALTAFWKFQGTCENRPKNFPTSEGWIEIPKFD